MKYKAVVVDDETDSVRFISALIEDHCKELMVAGTALSAAAGAEMIRKVNPDVVFLDVEMPQGSGFDLLREFPVKTFEVIFITAYNNYAIDAIKFSALDYILKPVSIRDFLLAVERFLEKKKTASASISSFATLFENLQSSVPKKLAISTTEGLEYIETKDIIRIEADGSYSCFYLNNRKRILVSRPLRDYHEILAKKGFFRTHNSYVINLSFVSKFIRNEYTIVLTDGSTVPLARSKKALFLEHMSSISCHPGDPMQENG